jgi:hypothetical protein
MKDKDYLLLAETYQQVVNEAKKWPKDSYYGSIGDPADHGLDDELNPLPAEEEPTEWETEEISPEQLKAEAEAIGEKLAEKLIDIKHLGETEGPERVEEEIWTAISEMEDEGVNVDYDHEYFDVIKLYNQKALGGSKF